MTKHQDPAEKADYESECGTIHDNCPNSPKGVCSQPNGHSGSHQCGSCSMYF